MARFVSRLMGFAVLVALAVPGALSQAVSFSSSQNSDFSRIHADFNSDGREDFIIYGTGSNGCPITTFGLVLSTGDGIYQPPVCYTLPAGSPTSFAIGDFNGDGNPDVIVSHDSRSFYEYLGGKTGTLHRPTTLIAPTTVFEVAAADANHDGKIDLLFDSQTMAGDLGLHVWFGNGKGGFTAGPSTTMTVDGTLSIGDFDGDGNVDVLSQNVTFTTTAQVFYGDGTGHFKAMPTFSDDSPFALYDVNGDGRIDLVTSPFLFSINGNTYFNSIKVYYGNTNQTFTQSQIALANCTNWNSPPTVADFNGDGINDIAVIEGADCQGNGPDTVNVLLGNGNGTYQAEQVVYTGTSSQLLASPLVLRADLDSKPDFIFSDVSSGNGNPPGFLLLNTTIGNFPKCNPPNGYEGITMCAPTSTVVPAGSPVQFSIGAANQTAGRKVEVWIDGAKKSQNLQHAYSYYSFLDAGYNLSAGKHSVTVFSTGWDNLIQKFQFPLTLGSTCTPPASPGVNVCSPINNATVNDPMLVWAGGTVSGQIARMEVWVDGVKMFSSFGSRTLKTNLALASGTHKLVFYAINKAGQKWTQAVTASLP